MYTCALLTLPVGLHIRAVAIQKMKYLNFVRLYTDIFLYKLVFVCYNMGRIGKEVFL